MSATEQSKALGEVLARLEYSSDTLFPSLSVQELTDIVKLMKETVCAGNPLESSPLLGLLAPTGSLQETAIENGWGDAFLKLADKLDARE